MIGAVNHGLMPLRKSLVAECTRVIEARIAAGEWSERLPGERKLAALLKVGRDTVRLALEQLEKAGRIGTAGAGRRRLVRAPAGRSRTQRRVALRVGMLSPVRLERLLQPMLLEVDVLREALQSHGGSLELFAPEWYGVANPERQLVRLVRAEPCAAWILYRSSAAMQQWFERSGVRCLVRGYPHEGVALPHLDIDWGATARHAAGLLWRHGHRRVGVFIPPGRLRGVTAASRAVAALGEEGFEAVEIPEDGTTEGLARALSRALRRPAPLTAPLPAPLTALLATRPRQIATALTWLGSQGAVVPRDVSLVSLAHEPFLDHLMPRITHYRAAPERIARRVSRLLETIVAGQKPGGSPWVMPELVPGESVGAV